ncbi:MAG: hypothetical protein ACRDJM_00065 [Actinomycetota bacterium]
MRFRTALVVLTTILGPVVPASAIDCSRTSTGMVPLSDLGTGTYQGQEGGLYPGGSNERPAVHNLTGETLARLAVPRDAAGEIDLEAGRTVLLTIGMSNTRSESASLVRLAATDPLRHPQVTIVNGAQGGQDAVRISDPASAYWTFVDQQLTAAGVTPAQVQAIWLKEAIAGPRETFPADAERLQSLLQDIVEILDARFPNMNLIYLSSRIYAGYATTTLNPEPYAYQSAFSVKWLIENQIDGTYPVVDPATPALRAWLSWAAYLWADGLAARSDGLTWLCSDFASDGVHPNTAGSDKVAGLLLDFFHADSTAKIWYSNGGIA